MTKEEIKKLPVNYKGPGMCSNCAYSRPSKHNPKHLACGFYASMCKLVSRNCSGIKLLK